MKSTTLTALVGATALCLTAGTAQAAVTFIGYQTGLSAGESLVTGFEGGPTLADVSFLESGYSLAGTATLFTGTTRLSAAPATSPGTRDTTQYLSVQKGKSATLDTPLLSSISFYIGSLDSWNSFTFNLANGTTQVVTGAALGSLPGMSANGSQTSFTTNGRLTFSFDSAIDSVIFASSGNALEIGDIAAITASGAIPEPAAWTMMIMGFGGMGSLLRRRQLPLARA